MIKVKIFAMVLSAALAAPALGAESPNLKGAPKLGKAPACTVDRALGVRLAGAQTCVRIYGAVRFEAARSGSR